MVLSSAWQAWALIVVSGAFEVGFSVAMKHSQGFTQPVYSLLSLACGAVSVWLVATTLQILPVGTAYAVWAGIGAIGTAVVGIFFLGEPANAMRLGSMALVVAGIVGLQLSHH